MITCKKCGTTFATRARSSSTRCKGCGAAVYVPASVREANGGEAASARLAGSDRSMARDGPAQIDGVAIILFSAAGAVWLVWRIREWWRSREQDPPPSDPE